MSLTKLLKKKKGEEADPYHPTPEAHPQEEGDDESNWLVSYADMMTLLCGFFIMMFSMSKMDEPQYEKVKEAVAKQFGGDYRSPTKEFARFVSQVLNEAGVEKEVAVKFDPGGVSLTFSSTILFDTLSSEVTPPGRAVLNKLIEAVATRQTMENKQYKVVVEGHTDGRPIMGGNFASNWELSASRASRVVRMFLERNFDAKHMTAIGYADTYPEAPSRLPNGLWDEPGLAKNRRVVIRVLEPRVDSIPYPEDGSGANGESGTQGTVSAPPAEGTAPAPVVQTAPQAQPAPAPVVQAPAVVAPVTAPVAKAVPAAPKVVMPARVAAPARAPAAVKAPAPKAAPAPTKAPARSPAKALPAKAAAPLRAPAAKAPVRAAAPAAKGATPARPAAKRAASPAH